MITGDLIEYIKSELNENVSKNLIISNLIQVGWMIEDINEGFASVEASMESIPVAELTPKEEPKPINNPEPVKVWIPSSIKPKDDVSTKINTDEPKTNIPNAGVVENYSLELESGKKNSDIPAPSQASEDSVTNQEDLIPLISKNRFDVSIPVKKEVIVNLPESEVVTKIDNITTSPVVMDSSTQNVSVSPVNIVKDVVPKTAMISSYSQDILAASKDQEKPKNNKSRFIKIGIFIIIFAIIGSMIFAFVEGYIKIPGLNWKYSVVKKDPKAFLVGAVDSISLLNSYKVETNINISTPSLSSITTGLSNGEATNNANDRDSVSINTKGVANRVDGKLNFQYVAGLTSSILKNDIESNLNYDGKNLYASVPDLKEVLGNDAPQKNTVIFTSDQIGMVIDQFSPKTQDIIKKVDGYNISSGKIPLYVKTKIKSIFEEFINSLSYVEKGKEDIHGVNTYHYELTADKQSTKKLLVSLSDLFIISATDEQKKSLDEMLGASSIGSFDVWIGVDDNNLYQIKFTLNTPLSKVLGLNDSGIAGNEVQIDWKTTYYDLNVPNQILTPTESINIDTFVNGIKDTKIKNILLPFKQEANALKNSIGSYGLRTNPTGSCTNPNPSTLFSPLGHKKGSETVVSNIATSMNNLLSVTNGVGFCFSTPKEWAIAVPIYSVDGDNSPKFFCTDSAGNSLAVINQITGTICK